MAFRTGLTMSSFMEMSLWQFNSWMRAQSRRQKDSLALQVQAAYYNAYWNSATKHKKSLNSVLKDIYREERTSNRKKIDFKQAESKFKKFEEILTNGWTVKTNSN